MGDFVNKLATKAYRMNCEITLSVLLVATNHIFNFGSPESEQTQTQLHVVASTFFFASEPCRRRELIDETSHTKRGPAPVKVQNKRGDGEKGTVFVATVGRSVRRRRIKIQAHTTLNFKTRVGRAVE